MSRFVRWIVIVIGVGVAVFVAIQFVPYGRDHSNPPVTGEPAWDSAATRDLARRACFDCHSNETVWPWYSSIAPSSWLLQRDVEAGREALNFSEWPEMSATAGAAIADAIRDEIDDGGMPPRQYLLLHSEARLSDAEKAQLVTGMARTLGAPETER